MNDRRDLQEGAPRVDRGAVARFIAERFGWSTEVEPLASYIDLNFRVVDPSGQRWVFKVSNAFEDRGDLELQHAVLARLAETERGLAPVVQPALDGSTIQKMPGADGREHWVRMVSFVEGTLLSEVFARVTLETWRTLGATLARVDRALATLEHQRMHRAMRWDLGQATWTVGRSPEIVDLGRRALVERAQSQFLGDVVPVLETLPSQLIYNDANDNNLVVGDRDGEPRVTGLFDFGDVVHTARIFELAIAAAYAIFDADDPIAVIAAMVAGYHAETPLEECELAVLLPSIQMRLVVSVIVSNADAVSAPDNDYIRVSEERAWTALDRLSRVSPREAVRHWRDACDLDSSIDADPTGDTDALHARRRRVIGGALSLSYGKPLHVVRGRRTTLFDHDGRAYLDGVNNICHLGHCHPHVVAAAQQQIETLNTNTRYLHDHIVTYAERLTGLLPDPLEVCHFVNSGSEANELALRMARAHTGRHAVLALGAGYHGNTNTLIDISSYKNEGSGGAGAPEWVYTIPCPDAVRGEYRGADACDRYLDTVRQAFARAESDGRPIAAFIAEPIIGCGGQVVPPDGYLREAFTIAHEHGAVTIADEVQVGFGRTGPQLWASIAQGATPDIITLGKPIGNGHPLAAVVTRREIADAFDNGMEYFSSFGGNPVSCAVGLAVLDVIETERLPERAIERGAQLTEAFRELATRHPIIADVRGMGLYLGVELMHVDDTGHETPAADVVTRVLEIARNTGVLLSYDGPERNVLKIKPPLVISEAECRLLVAVLERALTEATASA